MLINFVCFPLFLLVPLFAGSLLYEIISFILQVELRKTFDIGLLGMLGLFFLGMLGIVINFFMPLTTVVYGSVVIIVVILGVCYLIAEKSYPSIIEVSLFAIISLICSPLAGSMQPGYDGGLYHLPHQLWLRSDPIIIGLANFHGRFGFASLFEYLAASVWFDNQYLFVSYLQASFIVYFVLFLIYQARCVSQTHQILVLGVIVGLVGYHNYIPLLYTYTDVPAALLFAAAFIFGHRLISLDEEVTSRDWTIFSLLLISAVFYKVSTILLLLWFGCVVYVRIISKRDSLKQNLLGIALPALFLCLWLYRNILLTGCLLFPLEVSCMDLAWAAPENAIELSKEVTAWARHPWAGLYSLTDNSWFQNWWVPRYGHVFVKYMMSGLLVAVVYAGLFIRQGRVTRMKIMNFRYGISIGFIILAIIFWFHNAPNPRFGIGPIMLLFPVVFIFMHSGEHKKNIEPDKLINVLVVIGAIIFTLRIGDPWARMQMSEDWYTLPKLTVPLVKSVKAQGYGVSPVKTNQCWLVPECSPHENRPELYESYGYKMFKMNKNNK